MTPSLWIAFGFSALLIIFLIIAFFSRDKVTDPTKYNILRFLSALCAAFAGSFFVGDALFTASGDLSKGIKFSLTGATGFASFFLIWLTYPKMPEIRADVNTFDYAIPQTNQWTFEVAIKALFEGAEISTYKIEGFTDTELSMLVHGKVKAETLTGALEKLSFLNRNLPKYSVTQQNEVYNIKKI